MTRYGQFGPIALYAGGTGEVRFKEVGYKDLQPRVALPEQVSSHFRMQALNEFYYSWGPSVADINHDNVPDIVAGPYYYLGPDYTTAREIYLAQTIDASTQYFNGLQFAYDFTGDGWPDVINVLFTRPVVLYVNPRGESRRWEKFTVTDNLTCELGLLKDIDGDGKPELLFKDSENQFVFARPDPAHPTDMWVKHPISEKGPWANHGMGVGDINGDGRMDFANAYGWWEQPPKGTRRTVDRITRKHSACSMRSSPGGAEMAIYDVNGDGLNDIVTSLQAHGWGLAWFEQKKNATGRSASRSTRSWGTSPRRMREASLSRSCTALSFADIDGDGIPDFVTGKRFWSHLDTFIDPDPHGPPVLYVVSNREESEGAWRRRVRPGADPQPLGNRIHGGARRSRQRRRNRHHHVNQARHVHLLEQLEEGRGDGFQSAVRGSVLLPEFVAELLQAGLVDPCGLQWRQRHALGRIELRHDHQLVARALERFHDGLHIHLALTERAIS